MLRLFVLYILLAFSLNSFSQTTVSELSFRSFHTQTKSCDTLRVVNPSLNTTDWTKDQVGQTTPFTDSFIDFSDSVSFQNFTFFNTSICIENADGIVLYFTDFNIPKGGTLYIKGIHSSNFFTYNHEDNLNGGAFATLLISDDAISIIYQQRKNSPLPNFSLSEIGVINNEKKNGTKKGFGASGDCLINVNCTEGNNWQNQKRSAVKILTKVGNRQLTCSGTLMNNTAEDFTPYILTAEHCANVAGTHTYSTAEELESWLFYFNYESDDCTNPSTELEMNFNTMTGATFIAQSHDMGGDDGSDFFLVKLEQDIPDSYCAYYAGWNRENTAAQSGVSIHHPSGDIKKISTFNTAPVSDESINGVPNTYWRLQWSTTTNGHSITEGGSSGSSLFDQNNRMVGTLNGGNAACDNLNGYDWYGKFAYHWESNGTGTNRQLKPYLDPLNSGVMTLNGIDNAVPIPQITISASQQNVCDNETIVFSIDSEQNQGTSPSYKWYVNDLLQVSTRDFSSDQLKNNDVVKVVLRSSLDCVSSLAISSNEVVMSLFPTIETAITIQTNSTELCSGESATFTIAHQTGDGTYQWFLNNILTSTTSEYTSDTLETDDLIKATVTSTESCKSSNKVTSNFITMTVEDIITPSITIILLNESFPLCENTNATFTTTTTGIGQTGEVEWFKNNNTEGAGLEKTFSDLMDNDSIRATLTSSLQCATTPEAYSDTTKVSTTICTGIISQSTENELLLFPNPFSEEINIIGENIIKISFINTIGQTVLVSHYQETINCEELPSGVYIIVIETENKQQVRQLIKR